MSKAIRAPWRKYYRDEKEHLEYPDFSAYKLIEYTASKHLNNISYNYYGKCGFNLYNIVNKFLIFKSHFYSRKMAKALAKRQVCALHTTFCQQNVGLSPKSEIFL